MVKKIDGSIPVSANNPCPFLRALVAAGQLSDDREPLDRVAAVIVATASAGDGSPELPSAAVVGIGLVANGLNPLALMDAMRHGWLIPRPGWRLLPAGPSCWLRWAA